MGHGHSRQKIQLEKIIQEVKDIQLYIRQNVEEFDDKCRDNLHQRLIEYSHSLQDIFETAKKKNSKECKEATKFVINVLDELYKQKPLDSGSVETNSFIHVTSKDVALLESGKKVNGERKQTRSASEIVSQSKHLIPSLEDIRMKTMSLKNEVERDIKIKDINHLKMQQKIVQILATDLEMLCIENYTASHEIKVAVEKELNLMYRRIEKAKKRHNDAMLLEQEKDESSMGELSRVNSRLNQVVNLAPEEKLSKTVNTKNNVTHCNQELHSSDDVILNDKNIKLAITVKNKQPASYLGIQDEHASDFIVNEQCTQQENVKTDNLSAIKNICSSVDQCMSQAKIFIKIRSFENLAKLKNQLCQYSAELQKCSNADKDVVSARLEVENKIKNTLEFFDSWLNGSDAIKDIKRTDENLDKAKILIGECWDDIMKFDHTTTPSEYVTYNTHLDGLESFLNKVTLTDEIIIARKAECLKRLHDCRKHLDDKYEQNIVNTFASKKYNSQLTNIALDNIKSRDNIVENESQTSASCGVVLRKKVITSGEKETKLRTIEGFYRYWRELQSNLPSHNCTYERLHEIVALLKDIEAQIEKKCNNIENFLSMKEKKYVPSHKEAYGNHSKTNTNALKTHVRIYKLNETQTLTPDDDKTDNIDEQLNKIIKQNPEKVFLQNDDPITESGVLKKIGSPQKETKRTEEESVTCTDALKSRNPFVLGKSNTHCNTAGDEQVEYISQINNITTNVQHMRKKALLFRDSKQTPIYTEIKAKLDSYRKTVNILSSYQNENMTLSCDRLLKSIDEVLEILNSNSEVTSVELPQPTVKTNTIEILFTDIIEMKSRLEDIANTVNMLDHAVKKEVYSSIRDELLRNRKVLNDMKIRDNYVVILNTKADVMKEIEDILYNLNRKSEGYKIENQILSNQKEKKQNIITEFKKVKERVNRFYGTYKNVLYREIEKNIQDCLHNSESLSNDEPFQKRLKEDAILYMRILKQKAIGSHNCDDSEHKSDLHLTENVPADIKQHYKDLRNDNLSKDFSTFKNQSDTTNNSSKTSDNRSNPQTSALTHSPNDIEVGMSNIEEHVKSISNKIEDFENNKCSVDFFNLDEGLTRLSMNVDKLATTKGTDLHKKKIEILNCIDTCYEVLESKAQSYEIFQNVESKVNEVEYRLANFHNLSCGDYSALYNELIDLDETLKHLDVTGKVAEKRLACQRSIQQCLMTLDHRNVNQNATDSSSEDGTSV